MVYVLFSGGKDSTVALLKTLEQYPRDKIQVIFNIVKGNTAKENIQFVKQICEEFNLQLKIFQHEKSFWDYVDEYFLPGPQKRWCYRIFKQQYWNKLSGKVIVGIKKTDSKFRSKKYNKIFKRGKQLLYSPVWEMTNEEIYDYLKDYGIDIPTYKKYGCNANCIFCPFYNINMIKRISSTEWKSFLRYKLLKIYNLTNSNFENKMLKRWLRYLNNHSIMDL